MSKVTAVHTFVAEHGDELEFQAGETIEVIERDDGFGDGWWRGRNEKGEEGLFPATYITEIASDAPAATTTAAPEPAVAAVAPVSPSPVVPGSPVHVAPPIISPVDTIPPTLDPLERSPSRRSVTPPPVRQPSPVASPIKAPQTIPSPVHTPPPASPDLGIGSTTRAHLAAQAQLANEQRDLHRASGGVAGLVYSDESDDEDDEPAYRSNGNGNGHGIGVAPLVTTPGATSPGGLEPPLPVSTNSPVTWTADQVVAWAQSKGFEDSICQKFREHEITGDLLLELDANLLKELDIPQFGKRLRIAQAINELRPTPAAGAGPAPIAAAPAAITTSTRSAQASPSPNGHRTPDGVSTPSEGVAPDGVASSRSDPAFSAWTHSRRASSTTPATMTAIREGKPTTPVSTSISSLPASPITPNSTTTKRESTGSMGHKRGKASMDRDRLSFFGRRKAPPPASPSDKSYRASATTHSLQPDQPGKALTQIGTPDHSGYIKKKTEYNTWKTRYVVLKGSHLYLMKNSSQDRVKGNINLQGYRVVVDSNANPGSYGFRLMGEKPHYFSSSEQSVVREWLKALMKATIARDYSVPVTSSCNIPTIPLAEAQALSPRPPSPATRDATQRATRRENTTQLTAHDATVLMSLPSRPSRDTRRPSTIGQHPLVEWVNQTLPQQYPRASSLPGSFVSGEVIFLLVRSLSGIEPNPPVPPNAFAPEGGKPGVSGLFAMMDLLIDAGVDTAGVSLNDIREGDHDSIVRLLESVKGWSDNLRN